MKDPLQVSYVVSSVDHNLVVSLVLDRIVVEVVRFSAEDTARSQLLFVRSSVYRLPVFIWLFPFDSYLFCSPADFAHFDESVLWPLENVQHVRHVAIVVESSVVFVQLLLLTAVVLHRVFHFFLILYFAHSAVFFFHFLILLYSYRRMKVKKIVRWVDKLICH
jgi:hypothetical protein